MTGTLPPGTFKCGGSGLRVDLRALQLPGVVDVDDLGLRVEVVDGPPTLAVAVSRLLHTPERQVRLGTNRRRVHVSNPIVEPGHGPERRGDARGVEGARQPVPHVVVDLDRLVE